jgi:hypothetical protein
MSNESSSSPQPQQHNNNNNNKSHKMSMSTSSSSQNHEDELRKSLRQALQSLSRREPLEPTYKKLILHGTVTSRRPVLVKDNFYRKVGSRLRERVESFLALTQGKDPFDRISQRQPLEDSAMRAALTLREAKEHEQQPLLDATLAALGMDEQKRTRQRHFEGMALMLQTEKKKPTRTSTSNHKSSLATTNNNNAILSAVEVTEQARHHAELERQRAQARARELARRRRDEEERQQAQEELARKRKESSSPEQTTLHKYYYPIFKKLWDMEFVNLNSTNPFRIVIDRDNCAAMGAADYFDVIKTPVSST